MKRNIVLAMSLVVALVFTSCKNKVEQKKYSIEEKTLSVKWTAYKTTDKVPVAGKFKRIFIKESKEASSVIEAVNNAKFSIPINSIFTNNHDRDNKLKQFFFGVMKDTEHINGTVFLEEGNKGKLSITMNGITASLPVTYTISGQLVTIKGVLNLDTWKGKIAIESLNKVCFDLHKGADGVSKTWNEVQVEGAVYVKFDKKE